MEFKIRRFADVSTCHITEEDSALLEAIDHINGVVASSSFEYGFLLRISSIDKDDNQQANIKAAGFSNAFCNLMKLCAEAELEGIQIDRDGAEYAELERFEW